MRTNLPRTRWERVLAFYWSCIPGARARNRRAGRLGGLLAVNKQLWGLP